jgi:hypothetical protein
MRNKGQYIDPDGQKWTIVDYRRPRKGEPYWSFFSRVLVATADHPPSSSFRPIMRYAGRDESPRPTAYDRIVLSIARQLFQWTNPQAAWEAISPRAADSWKQRADDMLSLALKGEEKARKVLNETR